MSVLTADHCSNAGLLVVPGGGMGHVRPQEDDRLIEHLNKSKLLIQLNEDITCILTLFMKKSRYIGTKLIESQGL